ncbi:hypothetical protein [Longimicrobium sp.]|uniref:hypothetical protein n=1 Tax=Longimicrobium sp. TaxID=2029185 RepID=UPI002E2FD9DB|nr:hypothetical protein [Longimicrobium sp.]HEX6042279.1 hypothetical protein [Longimicrobium sp.]
MADPFRDPDPADVLATGRGSPPATPRWVKVFGTIGIVLVLLLVLGLLTGRHHGPGRHLPGHGAPSGKAVPQTQPGDGQR